MNKSCKQCLYFDRCSSNEACEDYASLVDDIDEIIELEFIEFCEEWFKYIDENED